jgi:NADH ubiquinone oxidoreductase subunit NDUFA12
VAGWISLRIVPIVHAASERTRCSGVGRSRGEAVLSDLKANSFFTMLQTWLKGEPVGVDEYGNRYYRERGAPGWRKERRWVVFSRDADPTRVPAG